MPAVPHRFAVVDNEVKIAAAYNRAGYCYAKYADGCGDKLFCFEGRHAYADRKTWELIDSKLLALRMGGLHRLRVLDLGCGPGTWLRRVVVRARQMGFAEIEAQGLDIADAQLHRARALSSATPLARLSQELARLEERYCRDPGFIDHAAHLLLVARGRKEARKCTGS